MGTPHETTNEAGDDERTTGSVPANTNTNNVTGFSAVAETLIETESLISLAQQRQVALWDALAVAQQRRPPCGTSWPSSKLDWVSCKAR
jgi:hypothetical protein